MIKLRKHSFIKCISFKKLTGIMLAICLVSVIFASAKTEFVVVPAQKPTIVIDAGHGGVDGGCVGRFTGVVESDLNLIYAKNLKEQFLAYGFGVVMTRQNSDGLYDKTAKNLKKSDMKKRKEIIESSGASVVLSIHMNSYPKESSRGAQVFFGEDNEQGKALAISVQTQLKNTLNNTTKTAQVGDYYIVNCTGLPVCLVECGFISNQQEESLLQQKDYQDKLCYAILCGVISFFGESY